MKIVLFACCSGGTAEERDSVRNSVVKMPEIATYAQVRLHGTTLAVVGMYAVTLHNDGDAERVAEEIRGVPGVESATVHQAEHNHP